MPLMWRIDVKLEAVGNSPQNMHTIRALLWLDTNRVYPYTPGLLHLHWVYHNPQYHGPNASEVMLKNLR